MNRQTSPSAVSGFFALIASAALLFVAPAARAAGEAADLSQSATALLHRRIALDPARMSVRHWSAGTKRWEWQSVRELPKAPVLFVHLWSVTCQPCVRELPFLAALIKNYQRLFGNKLDYLLMSNDEPAQINSFLTALGQQAPSNIYHFEQEEVEKSLGSMILPTTLFVERDGLIVRQAFVGSIDIREAEVKPGLTRLIELVVSHASPSKK